MCMGSMMMYLFPFRHAPRLNIGVPRLIMSLQFNLIESRVEVLLRTIYMANMMGNMNK
jgi:hypothetical protein